MQLGILRAILAASVATSGSSPTAGIIRASTALFDFCPGFAGVDDGLSEAHVEGVYKKLERKWLW